MGAVSMILPAYYFRSFEMAARLRATMIEITID